MVLGIVGSKRKNGNTATLVEKALEAVEKQGIETEIFYLGDYDIKGCTGCEGCQETYACVIQDDMQKLYPKLIKAKGLVLGSPTYFYNVSADVKAFIERLYCFEGFDQGDRSVWVSVGEALGGKHAVTIAICEQHDERDMGVTSQVMDASLASLGYRIVESVKVLELFDRSAAKSSVIALEQAASAGTKLAKTLMLRDMIRSKFSLASDFK